MSKVNARAKRQRNQFKSWIEAEQNPSKEALDAYAKLEEEIMSWEKTIKMEKSKQLMKLLR